MKSATFLIAPLVALLLLLPAPAAAASLAPPAPPAPEVTAEPAREPAAEATAEPPKEPIREPTAEPTALPTPEPTPEPEATSSIADLHATAGRLRGRVEIGWSVFSAPEQVPAGAVFVVERSTNGSSWRPVKACYVPFDGEGRSFGCTDARLASGATYAYRVCLAPKPTSCANALTSAPVSVKAP